VLEAPSVKPPSLRDAFNHFEVLLASSKQVDDQMLLALFEAKVNERPQDLDKHIASLTVIAENRTSTTLLDYIANLNKEPEVAEGMSLDDNSWIAVPSRGNLPVGLYNIGNTCYLNSLLQYYFSIRELRDKMIHYAPPATITLGNEQDKKGVSVYYAQHFTRLLGELYGHMTSSRDTALAPSTELAEMALLPANQVNTHKAQVDDGGVAPMDLSQSTHSNASGNGVIRIRNETDLATAPAEVARTPSSRFGKQEDVTECMDNVMQLLEMAFEEKKATGFPTRLFEGKMKQTLEYISTDKKQQVSAKEETFSHVIISVKEGDDVYKGMDEYFSSGEVVYDGVEAKRHVTITQLPPFLQIQLQRVQYDKEASRVFKSNAFVKLLPTIHMDRYLESNAVETQKRRHDVAHYEAQAAKWASNNQQLSPSGISLGQMARELAQFIQTDFGTEVASDSGIQSHQLTHLSTQLDDWDQLALQKSKEYAEKANSQFDDMNHIEYDLHAVFIHRGHASSGHYWIYIRDRLHKRWLKFNDSNVTEVDDVEVFQNRQGSHENPYLLIYVKADVADALVDAGGI
jgi:ubiquitin carboxyl-terminal hydrolase 25/28